MMNYTEEKVVKNSVTEAYYSLKGKINIWYGSLFPIKDQDFIGNFIHAHNEEEL